MPNPVLQNRSQWEHPLDEVYRKRLQDLKKARSAIVGPSEPVAAGSAEAMPVAAVSAATGRGGTGGVVVPASTMVTVSVSAAGPGAVVPTVKASVSNPEEDLEYQRAVEAHAEYLGMNLAEDREFLW